MPARTPDTLPELLTVAIPGETELHVPPPVTSLNAVVAPAQTVAVPSTAVGTEFTVTIVVAAMLPQPLVIV